MDVLVKSRLVHRNANGTLRLMPASRRILPEIVAIEAKVSGWQRAIEQAKRNLVFAHRSFIAIPERIASKLLDKPAEALYGVGIISVSDSGSVSISRVARKNSPTIWQYYFQLAGVTAQQISSREAQWSSPSISSQRKRNSPIINSSSR
jgi:hypothetical protein